MDHHSSIFRRPTREQLSTVCRRLNFDDLDSDTDSDLAFDTEVPLTDTDLFGTDSDTENSLFGIDDSDTESIDYLYGMGNTLMYNQPTNLLIEYDEALTRFFNSLRD